jgi:hypothetical protein
LKKTEQVRDIKPASSARIATGLVGLISVDHGSDRRTVEGFAGAVDEPGRGSGPVAYVHMR